MKDYWVALNPDKLDGLLTAEEKKQISKENLSSSQTYEMQLAHISSDGIANYSEAEKQVIAIFTKMNSAYSLSTVTLKNEGVTEQEVAKISERLGELQVDIDSDWDREYQWGDMLKQSLERFPLKNRSTFFKSKIITSSRIFTQRSCRNELLEEQYENV